MSKIDKSFQEHRHFLSFLENQACEASAVYILGDLFDAWIGDDDNTPLENLVYSYKLRGYETSWSDWTSSTSKTYTNLEEGTYTFMVKSRDGAMNVDPTPAEKSFEIQLHGPKALAIQGLPSGVFETFMFQLKIVDEKNKPVEEAIVVFANDSWVTDAKGEVTLKAPPVDYNKEFMITATKPDYIDDSKTIEVYNLPLTIIKMPSEINEGEEFTVKLMALDYPMEGEVTFNNISKT